MESSGASLFPEQGLPAFKGRRNMVDASSESWRPQLFVAKRRPGFLCFWLRCEDSSTFRPDLAWRDLRAVLPSLQGTVLDVGCGAQPFRSLVNPHATYLGIDTDAAKAHFGYEMPNTTYFSGDVWPVADCVSECGVVHRDPGARAGDSPLSGGSCALPCAGRNVTVNCSVCCAVALYPLRLLALYTLQP